MLLRHGLSDMLFLKTAYFLSRDIEKNDQYLIGVTTICSNPYPRIGQYGDSIAAHTFTMLTKSQLGI